MQLAALTITAQHFIQAFSWMLIHSLWQGLLLAVVTAIILMLTKKTRAVVRYNLVFVQFALFMLACGITFIYEWNKPHLHTAVPGLTVGDATNSLALTNIHFGGISHYARICMDYFTANAPLIVLLWFMLFLFRAMRVMNGLVYIHRAKNRLVYEPSAEWKAKVDLLCQKLQLNRAVQLLESGYVKMPMVIGHLKPVILVPVGLLAGLPAGQVEAVLLHELAHIRRNDYVVNFIQTLAETVFFFNPALLWISSLLRDERENCCDDVALEQTKNKREFIEALISFKEHSLYGANYQVAFPGKKNHLLNRVSRILNNQNKTLAPAEKAFFMAGVIMLSVMVATAAIAEVHLAMRKHKKAIPAVVAAPVKPTAKSVSTVISAISIKHTHELSPIQSPPQPPEPSAPQPEADPADDADKVQLKLKADQDVQAVVADKKTDQEQARLDQVQALKDQQQAHKDQEQALIDQHQAQKNQEAARRDQEEARKEQEQIHADQAQAKRNEEQEVRNQEQAKRNEEQAKRNDEQAERNKQQAERNKQQDKLNTVQARKNEAQAKLNQEQNTRNQAQAAKNQEQAAGNHVSVQ